MKKCSKCGKELPESEFYRKSKSTDGLQPYCKTCSNLIAKDRNRRLAPSIGGGNSDLAGFTPRQLIDELKARGYKGKLTYTKEIIL